MSVSSLEAGSVQVSAAPMAVVANTQEMVSLEHHRAFMGAVHRGEHPVEVIKASFEGLVQSKDRVIADISRLTVKELTKLVRPAYAGTRKPQLIGMYWDELLLAYAWLATGATGVLVRQAVGAREDACSIRQSFGATEEFVRKSLGTLTVDLLHTHLEYRKRLAEEQRVRWKAHLEALRDPRTIGDFAVFIEARGRDALSSEQRVRYDELIASHELALQEAKGRHGESSLRPPGADPVDEQASSGCEDPTAGAVVDPGVQPRSQPRGTLDLIRTRHTKKGHELFVVKLNVRVDRAVFDALNRSARMSRGYYSSYAAGGAVPGFTFEAESNARTFLEGAKSLLPADQSSEAGAAREKSPDLPEEPLLVPPCDPAATTGTPKGGAEVQEEPPAAEGEGLVIGAGAQTSLVAPANAIRLEAVAERLEAASRHLTRSDRLVNTPKRAAEAARAEREGASKSRLAATVRNIARAMREGEARYLGGLRDGSQVEFLDLLVRLAHHAHLRSLGCPIQQGDEEVDVSIECVPFAEMPSFSVHSHQVGGLIRALEKKQGCGKLRQRLRALADAAAPENAATQYATPEDARQCIAILGKAAKDALPWHWIQASERLGRLERLGVRRVEHLRAVLREYMRCLPGATSDLASQVRAAELALVGRQVGVDFFPTPKALARRMVEMAGVRPGMRALEPQAGAGAIADELRAAGAVTTVCELSYELRRILLLKGHELCGEEDFLQFQPEEKFPVIVCNPPFGGNADIKHFLHAFDKALAPGGTLVSIIGEGAFSRTGQVERGFQDQLTKLGAHVERLPAGTFSDRTLLNTTGANARLVMVKKL